MKIKRTKTGTKTSDSKHEIVKSEQNGNINNEDSVPLINCKKQANLGGVPASPSSSSNKRGNNNHRKDKVTLIISFRFSFFDVCFFRQKTKSELKKSQKLFL